MNRKTGPWPAKDERAYWRMRRRLLHTHRGRWVAVCDGKVIAQADDLLALTDRVYDSNVKKPYFVTVVGDEQKAVARVRRKVQFRYDAGYRPPLPRVAVTFGDRGGVRRKRYRDVIPDTGADATVLPYADCKALGLTRYAPALRRAQRVGEPESLTPFYPAIAWVVAQPHRILVEAETDWDERLLGRDVLNQLVTVFDGPARLVTFPRGV